MNEKEKIYVVRYSGNATRYKNLNYQTKAIGQRFAVEQVYQKLLDREYFPDENGKIFDSDNNMIADPFDNTIFYDGGFFYATEIEKIISTN